MNTATDMQTERSRALVHEMYGAVQRGDVETLFSGISPAVVVEEPPFLPYGGTYNGIAGLRALFAELGSRFDLGSVEFDTYVVDGEDFCAIGSVRLSGSGHSVAFIERGVIKDDKVVQLRIYIHDGGDLLS